MTQHVVSALTLQSIEAFQLQSRESHITVLYPLCFSVFSCYFLQKDEKKELYYWDQSIDDLWVSCTN